MYRSAGGDSGEDNLLTLCSVHHQLLHDGHFGIERAEEGLVFRFGDGRVVHTTHVGQDSGRLGRLEDGAAAAGRGPSGRAAAGSSSVLSPNQASSVAMSG
jgi:hypothetical protein